MYEWSRPYGWVPDNAGVCARTAERTQTFIHQVLTNRECLTREEDANVNPTFQPEPGATYYLGSLSPDDKRRSFYEIDRDNNECAGIVVTIDDRSPQIGWFDLAPDDLLTDEPAVWISDKEFIYPVKMGLGISTCAMDQDYAQSARTINVLDIRVNQQCSHDHDWTITKTAVLIVVLLEIVRRILTLWLEVKALRRLDKKGSGPASRYSRMKRRLDVARFR